MGKKKRPLVDVAVDKTSVKARTDRANVIAQKMTNSTLVSANPPLKDACDGLVGSGKALAKAVVDLNTARSALAQAETTLVTCTVDYDTAHAVAVAQAEKFATTDADLQGIGFDAFQEMSHLLAVPTSVAARYDILLDVIKVHVKKAPGMTACLVEISTDPNDPTKWVRVTGIGARRTLSGYAPGTYWIRAASVRASTQSGYTAPVAVIVK